MKKVFIILSILLIIGSLLFSFRFYLSYYKFYLSILELIDSFKIMINDIFKLNLDTNNLFFDLENLVFEIKFPCTWNEFTSYVVDIFNFIFTQQSFKFYLKDVMQLLLMLIYYSLFLMPFVFLGNALIKQYYFVENDFKANQESKPLESFKKIYVNAYSKVVNFIINYKNFLICNKIFLYIIIAIWMMYFNVYSIILEFFSFYFVLIASLDFSCLYLVLYRMLVCLVPLFEFVPLWCWCIIGLFIFHYIRCQNAINILHHNENKNMGYINSTGQVSMLSGSMGTGKTLQNTDMLLSQEKIYRDKALKKLLEYNEMFPHFPFAKLEEELRTCVMYHHVYNLATCKTWITKVINRSYEVVIDDESGEYSINLLKGKLFGYDFDKYPTTYNDGAKIIHLYDFLENYTKMFFVYFIKTSFILANYSVRTDGICMDKGNFPLWDYDFFNRKPEEMNVISRYCHIIDFDMLRLGKQIVLNNEYTGCLEFGIIAVSEVGKERKNQIELRGVKRVELEANQLNDGFNNWLKIARHAATIDGIPFIKILLEDQRPESLGADARELCTKITYIEERSEPIYPLMLFELELMLYDLITSKFNNIYLKYRFYRKDDTLLFYILKSLYSRYFAYINRLKNTYGFTISKLNSQHGQLATIETAKYYLAFKKIYADRYATDCYGSFFEASALACKYGLFDVTEYKGVKASVEELSSQNSYYINELLKIEKRKETNETVN